MSEQNYQSIDRYLKKINLYLEDVERDLVVLRLIIRRNVDKYYPPRVNPHHKSYADRKPALAYFEGSASLRLSKKRLYVDFKGQSVDECIKRGFKLIFSEIKKYKDKHFVSESQYPNHSTVRGK